MADLHKLLNEGKISRTVKGDCVEFLIKSKDIKISDQGIHTLKNEKHCGLIECRMGTRNGENYLRYYVTGLKTLSEAVADITADGFVRYLINLKSVLDIENFDINNGFLNKNNVMIDFDDVYVDANSGKVYLIYIPLVNSKNEDNNCENMLDEAIRNVVKSNPNLSDEITEKLCERLGVGVPAFEALSEVSLKYNIAPVKYDAESDSSDVYPAQTTEPSTINRPFAFEMKEQRRGLFRRENSVQPAYSEDSGTEILADINYYLVSEKLKLEFELPIGTTSIGQNNNTDIDLSALQNKAISRYHAEIIVNEYGGMVIKDVGTKGKGSKNGTFIIKGLGKPSRLTPNKEYKIGQGSKIRIANVDFIIAKK